MVTVGAGEVTEIVAFCDALPPAPVQVNVYVPVLVRLVSVVEPAVAFTPLQPVAADDAVQVVALVLDQVNVLDAPLMTDVGLALNVTVGAGTTTATVTDWLALPPTPLQLIVNVELAVMLLITSVPDVVLVPLQLPEAVQLAAEVALHTSVALPFKATLPGLADNTTVGAGVPETGLGTIAQTGAAV